MLSLSKRKSYFFKNRKLNIRASFRLHGLTRKTGGFYYAVCGALFLPEIKNEVSF